MKCLYLVIPLLMLDVVDLSKSSLDVCCDDFLDYDDEIPEPEPLQGAAWPIPKTESKLNKVYKIGMHLDFELDRAFSWNDLLTNVTNRFLYRLHTLKKYSNETKVYDSQQVSVSYAGEINHIAIYLETCCESSPHPNMSEYYKLRIHSNILIDSYDVWGVIRAFDTLLQLCYTNEVGVLVINGNDIQDAPKYSHRGLMLDTESRYISVENILKMVDAMAMIKLNAFHWRIVGDTSFPYESKEFPELSGKGAFYPTMVYNASSIEKIFDFARVRGVMVIPELNAPGHLRSIGMSHRDMVTTCYSDGPATGPLDPTSQAMVLIWKLVEEMYERFNFKCIHLGGEEIDEDCWTSNPDVQEYMNIGMYGDDLLCDFLHYTVRDSWAFKVIMSLDVLKCEYKNFGWKAGNTQSYQAYSEDSYAKIKRHAETILSWPWDLSRRTNTSRSLVHMYKEAAEALSKTVKKFLVGGEAYMINALADDTNIFDIVWPRVSVVADVLWHGLGAANDVSNETTKEHVQRTIQEQTCRMVRFGIPVSPPGPGYCVVYDEENQSNATVEPKCIRTDYYTLSTNDNNNAQCKKTIEMTVC